MTDERLSQIRELAEMKYFLDTEFIESGPGKPIQLISIGIVCEDGREFYAVSSEFNEADASDWVKANVLPHIAGTPRMSLAMIAGFIQSFVADTKPEFWAYYADYDWVVFAQIFGTMMDLPKGWPMYCRDIKQLCDELGNPKLPEQASTEHNALEDARWNKQAHAFLLTLLDVQKKRIEELETAEATGNVLDEGCDTAEIWKLRSRDAEARASRAEQALKEAQRVIDGWEITGRHLKQAAGIPEYASQQQYIRRIETLAAAQSALSTERERVIQECARIAESMKEWNHGVADIVAQRIRALSSLPTPPQQTQWIRCEDFVPEYGTVSLVYCREIGGDGSEKVHPIQRLATYSYHGGWCVGDSLESGRDYHVTHWQPLPTPPGEEKA